MEPETFAPFEFDFNAPQGTRKDLNSFAEFVAEASKNATQHGKAWRGQADVNWRLTSSAFRAEQSRMAAYSPITGKDAHAQEILCISAEVEERMKDASRGLQKAIGNDPSLRLLSDENLPTPTSTITLRATTSYFLSVSTTEWRLR